MEAHRSGRRGPQTEESRWSHKLTYILRHGAIKEGVPINHAGQVKVSDLLAHNQFRGLTPEMLQRVVDTNDKKRFTIENIDGVPYIKAVQGHSMAVEVDMTPIARAEDVPIAVHGTNLAAWQIIRHQGLKPMGRLHVHFASGLPREDGVISGMRSSSDVLIYLDVRRALADGMALFRSANGVILTAGLGGVVSPAYFLRVTDRRGQPMPMASEADRP
ncbi:putative phosphotransferase KptA/Tpt1 [Paratrimastix pyriformis]|uniref:2'-phosphotransferase n=1 Tax=Paratrimastix pyriformis TaxID=342808 RepID=A0ABQ8V0V5_9EUKA|nr:putative phosphotransferase KptA/Tpt1 [Paratrimastix pyriformis]